jgi:hypothetical protein
MYSSYSFTTSALDWGEWSRVASRPRFTPGERNPGTDWTRFWVGPTASLDTKVGEKSLASARDRTSIARPSSPYKATLVP